MSDQQSENKASTPSKPSRRGKSSHKQQFEKFRSRNNERDFKRDVEELDKKMSVKLLDLKIESGRSAPMRRFPISTVNFRRFSEILVNYFSDGAGHAFTRWAFADRVLIAVNNVISDLLVAKLCRQNDTNSAFMMNMIMLQDEDIKRFVNLGPRIPSVLGKVVELTGPFTYGDLRQRFVPVITCEYPLTDVHIFDVFVHQAVCPFKYGVQYQWNFLIDQIPAITISANLLSLYGEVLFEYPITEQLVQIEQETGLKRKITRENRAWFPQPVPGTPGLMKFSRMDFGTVSSVMTSLEEQFSGRLSGLDFQTYHLMDLQRPGSVGQLSYDGSLAQPQQFGFVCSSLEVTSHDLQVGAAFFTPPVREGYLHMDSWYIASRAEAMARDDIFRKLARDG